MATYCPRCDRNFEGKYSEHECYSVGIKDIGAEMGMPAIECHGAFVNKKTSVLEREIWNAAIEAAAEVSEDYDDKYNIRKLKK